MQELNSIGFDLKELAVFRAVVERGGMTEAARRLQLSQSAVSRTMAPPGSRRGWEQPFLIATYGRMLQLGCGYPSGERRASFCRKLMKFHTGCAVRNIVQHLICGWRWSIHLPPQSDVRISSRNDAKRSHPLDNLVRIISLPRSIPTHAGTRYDRLIQCT